MTSTRVLIISLLTLLIILIVFATPLLAEIMYQRIRHIDPCCISQEINYGDMIEIYLLISRFISLQEFYKAREYIGNISQIPLPENIRVIIDRVNQVLDNTLEYLNLSRSLIDLANKSLSKRDFRDAKDRIARASGYLDQANMLVAELENVIRVFGISSQLLIKINSVIDNIRSAISDLRNRIDNMLRLIDLESRRDLIQTFLNISVEPRSISIGGNISITGFLIDQYNNPLGNRIITIHVGSNIFNVRTDSQGFYRLVYTVKVYQENISIYSEYIPRDEDLNKFSYSRSDLVGIRVDFIKPDLRVSLNSSRLRPTETLEITLSINPVINETITLSIETSFHKITRNTTHNSIVEFIKIPDNVSEGDYSLTVRIMPSGVVGPAVWRGVVSIYRDDLAISIEKPSYIFTGLEYIIKINSNTSVKIMLSEAPDIRYSIEETSIRIITPHTYLKPYLELYLTIVSLDPRYRDASQIIRITVYNSLAIATSILISASLIFYAIRRVLREVETTSEKTEIPETLAESKIRESEIEIIRDAITDLILRIHRLIERLSGVRFEKSFTYREFLESIKVKISLELLSPVERFYRALERYVYGGSKYRGLRESIERMARAIIDRIERLARGV
ncbi:MAG: hypothetical protein ABWJ42_03120 [Sulfolobales archaeon]